MDAYPAGNWNDEIANDLRDCGTRFNWFYLDHGTWRDLPKVCNRINGHEGNHSWIGKHPSEPRGITQ